ncbi:efflux RND transporter periplasmic adaptor subunit [Gracilimonas sp. Q87]|uniref:efflux RND transporter periplasmic adaptor subunit n=1 Tax=Gracilimonas sp. Q87 TaxID=3384766 RepID=UPI00398407AB
MGWKKTLIISISILIGSVAVLGLIFSTEPKAERSGLAKESAMLVQVETVEKGRFNPTITATGTVQASQEIMLGVRIEGEVIYRSPNFVPGNFVEKGDILMQIDSTDYVNELMQARSQLRQAESALQREMGLQEAAKREYKLLDDTLSEANRALVLRQPQLLATRAQVESAQATVNQVQLNLDRTTIRAPFNAYILDRYVNTGSLVSPGQDLGQLVGIDTYWVEAAVPLSKLRWFDFEGDGGGSPVQIRSRTAWAENEYREGTLFKMLGSLENNTRMAQVLVEIQDPMAIQPGNEDLPRLIIGSFVEVNIQGKALDEVVKVNRDHIRNNETTWVMQGDSLDIRDIEIDFQDSEFAYISSGLQDGDQIVTTNLANVTQGAPLRLEGEEAASNDSGVGE